MIFEVTLPNGGKMYTNLIITHRGSKPIEFRVVNIKDIEHNSHKVAR